MIKIVWLFVARPDRVPDFEARYSSSGDWALLFSRALGFRGTDMLLSADSPHTYLVTDRWDSLDHFNDFKSQFANQYADLDRACESLTIEERKIGVFYISPSKSK